MLHPFLERALATSRIMKLKFSAGTYFHT